MDEGGAQRGRGWHVKLTKPANVQDKRMLGKTKISIVKRPASKEGADIAPKKEQPIHPKTSLKIKPRAIPSENAMKVKPKKPVDIPAFHEVISDRYKYVESESLKRECDGETNFTVISVFGTDNAEEKNLTGSLAMCSPSLVGDAVMGATLTPEKHVILHGQHICSIEIITQMVRDGIELPKTLDSHDQYYNMQNMKIVLFALAVSHVVVFVCDSSGVPEGIIKMLKTAELLYSSPTNLRRDDSSQHSAKIVLVSANRSKTAMKPEAIQSYSDSITAMLSDLSLDFEDSFSLPHPTDPEYEILLNEVSDSMLQMASHGFLDAGGSRLLGLSEWFIQLEHIWKEISTSMILAQYFSSI